MIDFIQPTRKPLPATVDESVQLNGASPNWLPRQAGHTGLKFANGLEMAHNEASKATDRFDCPLMAVFATEGVEVRTDGSFSPAAIKAILVATTAQP
jgi:hypothetical protein